VKSVVHYRWGESCKPEIYIQFSLAGLLIRLFYFRFKPKSWWLRCEESARRYFVFEGPRCEWQA